MNNIVFIINVKKDGQSKPEYDFSIKSWKHFCQSNGHELFVLDTPIVEQSEMGIIWQRYFLFDLLDHNQIKYNQILIVDADTVVHPNCPDIFSLTDNKYTLVRDDGDYDWILRSMENYRKFIFKDEPMFDWWTYYNSGFQVVNGTHRNFFDTMRNFYISNREEIKWCQKTFGVGTDQTPLNFLLRREKIEIKELSYKYNCVCLNKKEVLDSDMLHTKVANVMHFNGLPDKDKSVPYWMEMTYKNLYENRDNR
jgi:lipopolysaccharide biosynthesis glycosyltransferase